MSATTILFLIGAASALVAIAALTVAGHAATELEKCKSERQGK